MLYTIMVSYQFKHNKVTRDFVIPGLYYSTPFYSIQSYSYQIFKNIHKIT